MAAPTVHQRCEQNGCRKRATTAIACKVPFGTQITGNGPLPVYMDQVTYRCPVHEAAEGAWGRCEIGAYRARLTERL